MPNSSDFNRFSVNPVNIDISRSIFNMNHSVKWSADIGEVIPFECMEIVPGDTVSIDTTKVIRLQPLVAPIFDEIILDTYWFFVPHRLVWNHFVNFMGENTESAWAPEVEYNIPTIQMPETTGFEVGTIADYLGVPPGMYQDEKVSALPFRSYALICDQWFRSEAIMDPVHVHVDDTNRVGVNTGDQVTDIELGGKPFIACRFPDYFSTALPSPQRGNPVSVPLVSETKYLPLRFFDTDSTHYPDGPYIPGKNHLGNDTYSGVHFSYINNTVTPNKFTEPAIASHFIYDSNAFLERDSATGLEPAGFKYFIDNGYTQILPSTFDSVSINDLRTAFAIQRYLERSARYGGRYISFIKGFFNVDSPDARLQRTEYLGGSRVSLNINSVEQTSATKIGETPLGNVAGMSVTADSNSDFTKSFTEHGLLIGCAVARYHHSYQQGLDKMFLRKTKYDIYNPVFANLGEQAVQLQEIDAVHGGHSTFGYQERWAEYRYRQNRIAGQMRSVYSQPLDMWHLGDYYDDAPTLSADWLREDKKNLDRCLAITSDVTNQMICDFYIECEASRPMPLYSIPGLIDHH